MFSSLKNQVIELSKNFYCITGPNQSNFPFCNTFLLAGEQTLLIDAGIDKETLLAIDKFKRIDILLFSHTHPDHILNWHPLNDRHIMMPKETPGIDIISDLQLLGKRFMGTTEKGNYWAKLVGEWLGLKPFREPDQRFKNGDLIDLGDFKLQAIHAPGHLNDHYCFFETESQTLLTSDIDFSGFGPFYGQPECAIEPFIESIHKVMAFPYRQICSSHKLPITGDATQLFKNFSDGFNRHEELILQCCETPQTIDQLTARSPIYKDRMPDKVFQETFERGMITKSLERMGQKGRVLETDDGYVKKVDSKCKQKCTLTR